MESSIGNKFIDGLTERNAISVKLLSVIFSLLMNPSIIKLSTDLLAGKAHEKNHLLHSINISLGNVAI
jgi:hypothetical protein